MILSKDINPEYNLYYVGSYILEILIALGRKSSFSTLHNKMYAQYKINSALFSLALDWLYIIGAVELNEQGEIQCS